MAVQNAIGDAFRGATWIALHNGGGVGWGNAINGGFGLLLDGSKVLNLIKTILNFKNNFLTLRVLFALYDPIVKDISFYKDFYKIE